jgi:hypothetical protein
VSRYQLDLGRRRTVTMTIDESNAMDSFGPGNSQRNTEKGNRIIKHHYDNKQTKQLQQFPLVVQHLLARYLSAVKPAHSQPVLSIAFIYSHMTLSSLAVPLATCQSASENASVSEKANLSAQPA